MLLSASPPRAQSAEDGLPLRQELAAQRNRDLVVPGLAINRALGRSMTPGGCFCYTKKPLLTLEVLRDDDQAAPDSIANVLLRSRCLALPSPVHECRGCRNQRHSKTDNGAGDSEEILGET